MFAQAVSWWARHAGGRTALVDDDTGATLTYAALRELVDRASASLLACGVRAGDRVAVLAPNSVAQVVLLLACHVVRCALVPINWRLSATEVTRVLAHAAPTLLFIDGAFATLAADSTATPGPFVCHDLEAWWRALGAPTIAGRVAEHAGAPRDLAAQSPTDSPSPDDAVMLLYTSGSTGDPKAVVVSNRQCLWNAVTTTAGWSLRGDDVALVCTPLFHTAGWHVMLTPLLWNGGTVVLQRQFEASACLAALARWHVTRMFAVPTQFALLQRASAWGAPLPALREFISGGAPCPPALLEAVRGAGYPMRDAYGLSECGPNCFAVPTHRASPEPGSVGWPLPLLEARIVDDAQQVVPARVTGELQLRGPQLFAGYFADRGRSARALTADGWLRTGDLAACDATGAFHIRGRRDDVFISGGEKVFPGEVEAALRYADGVTDVAVVGVADALWGEVGCAVIETSSPTFDWSAVLNSARSRLAAYKLPRQRLLVAQLPRLGSGKIDRRAVRALVTAAGAASAPPPALGMDETPSARDVTHAD